MSVAEYSLKFSTLSRYAASLLSNPRDEMSHFVMGVTDLVVEICSTTMLHDDMTLARLIVYAQSIEESKLRRMARCLNRSDASDQRKLGLRRRFNPKENLGVLSSRLRKEVVPTMASLLVQIVAKNIMVSVYWVPGVALVVVNMGTK